MSTRPYFWGIIISIMKLKLLLFLIVSCLTQLVNSQNNFSKGHRNFPLIVSLQFNSLSMPFKNMKANFSNIGIGIGTEVSHNGNNNWVQQFNVVWYRNKNIGNGLFLYSQAVWRPHITNNFYTELKLGAGYMLKSRPTQSFKQESDNWISVGKKGKGLFAIPVGVSIGHNDYSEKTYVSPFASYQFIVLKGYNESIPIVPETLIQVGSRIHFKD